MDATKVSDTLVAPFENRFWASSVISRRPLNGLFAMARSGSIQTATALSNSSE
jgi:hypothetical protein